MSTAAAEAPPTDDWLVLTWDTCQMALDEAAVICAGDPEQNRDSAFEEVLGDQSYWDIAWDDLVSNLSGIMERINPDGLWRAEVRNFGWQSRSGHKDIEAHTGKELLAAVLPKCDCTFKVYLIVDLLVIQNAHHDSPMGQEMYYITKRG